MKPTIILAILHLAFISLTAQVTIDQVMKGVKSCNFHLDKGLGCKQFLSIDSPPPYPVRAMAEWEELQALAISWRDYPNVLTEVVRHAAMEVEVVIFCNSLVEQQAAINLLTNANVSLDNVVFVIAPNDSAWIQDYGPVSVYANEVEDLCFIDWVYNRADRINDDALNIPAGQHFDVPVYSTSASPERFVNIGGNFLTDGLGTAFASKLVLHENGTDNEFGAGPFTVAEVDEIMSDFTGIQRYIKLDTLLYDNIHHVDMHMKLLDERTLLVGEYPTGIADAAQIEANLQYVLSNFNSPDGSPYQVVRIIQPPGFGYIYPPAGDFRSYTNSVFVNKTILVPGYEEQFDTIATRVYRENFPGYKVVTIDCNQVIDEFGALHCITKGIGVKDPLLISHPCRNDVVNNDESLNGYEIKASIKHRSGIESAWIYFRKDTTQAYEQMEMTPSLNPDEWSTKIPYQANGSEVYYYLAAKAVSGKEQVRPLAAPIGYCHFEVDQVMANDNKEQNTGITIYPNPATISATVSLQSFPFTVESIELIDSNGNVVREAFSPKMAGKNLDFFFDISGLLPNTYFVKLKAAGEVFTQRLLVF